MAAGDFYEQSIAAVQQLGVRGVMLAGGEGVARLTGKGSRNILIVDAAPHSQLFPRAAAIVQQCGIGTLGQALSAGCPILAVPFAHDQPDNAHRIEQARRGTRGVSAPVPGATGGTGATPIAG